MNLYLKPMQPFYCTEQGDHPYQTLQSEKESRFPSSGANLKNRDNRT